MKKLETSPQLKSKKLQLNCETLRRLDASDLERVVGGREDRVEAAGSYFVCVSGVDPD